MNACFKEFYTVMLQTVSTMIIYHMKKMYIWTISQIQTVMKLILSITNETNREKNTQNLPSSTDENQNNPIK